jgi:pSer/pThr/pTyr-binding forkhead associated (FHA) protein
LIPPPVETAQGWRVEVTVDPSLREAGSPAPPADPRPITIELKSELNLIGRTSQSRAIYPEIPLDTDDAVSHRHALLSRDAGGKVILRDIGSANGTRLNGRDVQPLTDIVLHDGDELTLGHWTRLAIKAIH